MESRDRRRRFSDSRHQCFPTADWLSTGAWEESRHLHSNKRADTASTSAAKAKSFSLFFFILEQDSKGGNNK